MFLAVRFFVLVAVTIWAATAKGPATLQWYFRANLIYVLALEPFILLDSRFYGWAWIVLTMLNLAASFLLTLDYVIMLPKWSYLALAGLVCGVFFGVLAWSGLKHPIGLYKATSILYGAILIVLAVPIGIVAEHYKKLPLPDAKIALTLSMLWFGLAGWSLGWPMYWHLEVWQRLNFVLPTVFVVAAFSYIGYLLRTTFQKAD